MDMRAELRQFITDVILSETNQQSIEFSDGESLLDAELLDSLGILKLISFLEDELGIEIPIEDLKLEDFESLDLVCAWIDQHASK